MSKKIIICGCGPSITRIDYRRFPKDAAVFRMNNFFFEDKYYAGRKVDYYYTDFGFLRNQFFNLYNLNENKEYDIDTIYSNQNPKRVMPTVEDIDTVIFQNKNFSEYICFYDRYYKYWLSGGIRAVFAAVMLGYDEIYMVGFDFYSNENYPWKNVDHPVLMKYTPRDSDDNIKNVINRYHPTEVQIKALELVKNTTKAKLYSICENTPLNNYVEMAPIINDTDDNYIVEEKKESYTKDWLNLPEIQSAVSVSEVQKKENLQNDIDRYKSEIKSLQYKLTQMESQFSTIVADKVNLESKISWISSENQNLVQKNIAVEKKFATLVKQSFKFNIIRLLSHITFGKTRKYFNNIKKSMLI